MKFTFYGHSCFLIDTNGTKILFDPFITYNDLAKDIDVSTIEADYILVSHGHQDHVADLVPIAQRTGAKVVCAYEIMDWLAKQGITNVHPMNIGGTKTFEFGKVRCVVAQHSSVMPDGTYGGNPMGFVISTPESNFYFAGDTALTMEMQLIPRWETIDFAILPVGDNFTMGASDAAMAADMVQTKKVIGVHFNTFPYIVIDKNATEKIFAEKQIEIILPEVGQTIAL